MNERNFFFYQLLDKYYAKYMTETPIDSSYILDERITNSDEMIELMIAVMEQALQENKTWQAVLREKGFYFNDPDSPGYKPY